MKKVTMFSYCARWFLCDKRLFKDILHTTEVTVNTNSHSSEIKWWFWNDVLREEKKKRRQLTQIVILKNIRRRKEESHFCT